MRFALCVPTLNAIETWSEFASALVRQSLQPNEVIVIDSASEDGTGALAKEIGCRVVTIDRKAFNHGGTRQLAASLAGDVDILVYMTQDAIFADSDSLKNLIRYFDRPEIAAAFGRQLPRLGAGAIESFARLYNYPEHPDVRTINSIPKLGFKTIFFSNSLGAWRKSAFDSVGGFPVKTNFGEDTQLAAKLILAGWQIAYAADAKIYHSHPYSFAQDFRRYKEVGKMHTSEPWLIERFGSTSSEGGRFVRAELAYLLKNAPHLIPNSILRSALKFWDTGRAERNLHDLLVGVLCAI